MERKRRPQNVSPPYQMITKLAPTDEMERMLVTQMFGIHSAAMDCFRRAMIADQSFEGRDSNPKHAGKLKAIYNKQMGNLNKHRGKGQQNIVVKYMNLGEGGQSIVGNVKTGKSASNSKVATAALEYTGEKPIGVFKF